MTVDLLPIDILQALTTEDQDGIPREALVASVKYLAEQLLEHAWSNTSVIDPTLPRVKHSDPDGDYETAGMRPLTWREVAEREHENYLRANEYANLLRDLDRCPHGRHEGDDCSGASGCDGPSMGNPFTRLQVVAGWLGLSRADVSALLEGHRAWPDIVDRQIGWTMDRRPIVVPTRETYGGGAEAWVGERP